MPEVERADAMAYASRLPSIQISERAICDLEMLAVGAFSPLDRFMGRRDYQSVLDSMRLANGHLFPIPVTLPVDPGPDIHLGQGDRAARRQEQRAGADGDRRDLPWDPGEMAGKVFGSRDPRHPMVAEMSRYGPTNISGRLRACSFRRTMISASCV